MPKAQTSVFTENLPKKHSYAIQRIGKTEAQPISYCKVISTVEIESGCHFCQHRFHKYQLAMWDSAEIQDFSLALNNQEQVDSTLLDMSKAINTDLHKCLCYRLFHYGIHGIPLMWIRNVSSDRAQKYILNGQSLGIQLT